MIIPVCFIMCSKIIGNKWKAYWDCCRPVLEGDVPDALGLKCYCYSYILLAHMDPIEKLLNYTPGEVTMLCARQCFSHRFSLRCGELEIMPAHSCVPVCVPV
uniref:Uncharacterized protein n=1 Tax=Catagonus wagneri TaxID=51154 RepID=A0A8C3YPD2_9CETA